MIKNSLHHSFDIELAAIYGVQAAILIHHFQHWISLNARAGRNFKDGHYWTFQTLDEIANHFPYWSKSEIFNLIELLCNGKGRRSKKTELEFEPVLKKGEFNTNRYDKTTWYCFVDEPKWILAQAKIEIDSSQRRDCSEPTPIPDTIPDTKTNTSNEVLASTSENDVKAKAPQISFSFERKVFENIQESDKQAWSEAYPCAIISLCLKQMEQWCLSNERNAKGKTNWRKFITNWLSKEHQSNLQKQAKNQISGSGGGNHTNPDQEKNLEAFRLVCRAFADKGRSAGISLKGKYVYHHTGDSVSIDLPHESFCDVLKNWTGAKVK